MLIVAAIAMLCGCTKENDLAPETEGAGVTEFTASIADDIATRTNISERKILWAQGDAISIDGNSYTAQSTGQTTTFTGTGAQKCADGKYHAYYPARMYSEGISSLPGDYPTTSVNTTPNYGLPMYAESETEALSFSNLTGVIALTMPATQLDHVSTITVYSDQRLNGAFTVASDGTLTFTSEAAASDARKVTLHYGSADGIQISGSRTFYIPVPAGSHTLAFMAEKTVNGTVTEKKMMTAKSAITIERNKLYSLNFTGKTQGTYAGHDWVQLWKDGPLFATMNYGAESSSDFGDRGAWSDSWDKWGTYWTIGAGKTDLQSIYSKTSLVYVNEDQTEGYTITGTEEGYTDNSIFLPVEAGSSASSWTEYWTCELNDKGQMRSLLLYPYWSTGQSMTALLNFAGSTSLSTTYYIRPVLAF